MQLLFEIELANSGCLLFQYELVGELFNEKVAGPAPSKRQRGVVVRAAKEQPKGASAHKSHRQTVGSQVRSCF